MPTECPVILLYTLVKHRGLSILKVIKFSYDSISNHEICNCEIQCVRSFLSSVEDLFCYTPNAKNVEDIKYF